MKLGKPLWIISIGMVTACLTWLGPMIIGWMLATPLLGDFEMGRCSCGDEMFLRIEARDACIYSPSHRSRMFLGTVTRKPGLITIMKSIKSTHVTEVRCDDNGYFIRNGGTSGGWTPLEKVTNPWRIWIPRLLPES